MRSCSLRADEFQLGFAQLDEISITQGVSRDANSIYLCPVPAALIGENVSAVVERDGHMLTTDREIRQHEITLCASPYHGLFGGELKDSARIITLEHVDLSGGDFKSLGFGDGCRRPRGRSWLGSLRRGRLATRRALLWWCRSRP